MVAQLNIVMRELSRKSVGDGAERGEAVSAALTRRLVQLGRDRRSGAAEIAGRARAALRKALRAGISPERLAEAGAELIAAQPAMAPLYQAVNDACLGTLGRARRPRSISLTPILPEGAVRAMTYSASSTVERAMVAARRAFAEVLCSEGRPGGEGLGLARALARVRLRVRLFTDAALFGRLEDVDLVLVGADALVPSGVVNKVGTRSLAALAQREKRPFYVVAERDKILPARFAPFFRLPLRPASEVARAARGVRIENVVFDVTPYRWVSGILSESGVLSRDELMRRMRAGRVSELLLEALRRELR